MLWCLAHVKPSLEEKVALVNQVCQGRLASIAKELPETIVEAGPGEEPLTLADVKSLFNDDWTIRTEDGFKKPLKDPLRTLAIRLRRKIIDRHFIEADKADRPKKCHVVTADKFVTLRTNLEGDLAKRCAIKSFVQWIFFLAGLGSPDMTSYELHGDLVWYTSPFPYVAASTALLPDPRANPKPVGFISTEWLVVRGTHSFQIGRQTFDKTKGFIHLITKDNVVYLYHAESKDLDKDPTKDLVDCAYAYRADGLAEMDPALRLILVFISSFRPEVFQYGLHLST